MFLGRAVAVEPISPIFGPEIGEKAKNRNPLLDIVEFDRLPTFGSWLLTAGCGWPPPHRCTRRPGTLPSGICIVLAFRARFAARSVI
jgi:hypothetical protein